MCVTFFWISFQKKLDKTTGHNQRSDSGQQSSGDRVQTGSTAGTGLAFGWCGNDLIAESRTEVDQGQFLVVGVELLNSKNNLFS